MNIRPDELRFIVQRELRGKIPHAHQVMLYQNTDQWMMTLENMRTSTIASIEYLDKEYREKKIRMKYTGSSLESPEYMKFLKDNTDRHHKAKTALKYIENKIEWINLNAQKRKELIMQEDTDLHTCHEECPCHEKKKPTSDFVALGEWLLKESQVQKLEDKLDIDEHAQMFANQLHSKYGSTIEMSVFIEYTGDSMNTWILQHDSNTQDTLMTIDNAMTYMYFALREYESINFGKVTNRGE